MPRKEENRYFTLYRAKEKAAAAVAMDTDDPYGDSTDEGVYVCITGGCYHGYSYRDTR